jgi:DNA mismatch repair protein MutS
MSRSSENSVLIEPETASNASEIDAALQHKLTQATPAMRQYFILKHRYPDCLLFYRMGDFYELFFEDAEKASRILDIALTKRGKHGEDDIAMCGVPVHSHESYLEKLIASGVKVAICEQMEDPAEAKEKRGYKAIVERDVVRVVTPGTITEDRLLDARRGNFLAALGAANDAYTLAWVDISTGEFQLQPVNVHQLGEALARLNPSELLLPETLSQKPEWKELFSQYRITEQPGSCFHSAKGERLLKDLFKIAVLDALGDLSRADLSAIAALLEYINLTQRGVMPRLDQPKKITAQSVMAIDPATARNLELVTTLSGQKYGSLLYAIDETVTAAGGRLLTSRLLSPLTDAAKINRRLDIVQFFFTQRELRKKIREALRHCPDIERALSRLHLQRGGPRDLQSILRALEITRQLRGLLEHYSDEGFPNGFESFRKGLNDHSILLAELKRALKEELPLLARDGGFIAAGYHAALDEFRVLRDESKRLVLNLQQDYQQETGISGLKIKFNNVLGYFVEITPTHEKKMTDRFIHRQTMKNALRYTSKELAELEQKITEAAGRALKIELECFASLCQMVTLQSDSLVITARTLAGLDVATALAELAENECYCRPQIEDSFAFAITNGRHPVVEQHLKKENQAFIANDCTLEEQRRLWLLTGPNMAGKSTFLRQNALITILAQMGSFVPAATATIGIVDRLFSRVGAADDLARGRSTFMVEMVETATILNQSTERSLVILDEIGRGTATYDGLSIAWATVEHLHNHNRCRALFATHYHELTQLAQSLSALACYSLKVQEWKGEIVFLHSVVEGTANRSYGVHVAALAGLPAPVINRAKEILQKLESGKATPAILPASELPLFQSASAPTPPQPSEVETLLQNCQPDQLSPREALDLVYLLKQKLKQ